VSMGGERVGNTCARDDCETCKHSLTFKFIIGNFEWGKEIFYRFNECMCVRLNMCTKRITLENVYTLYSAVYMFFGFFIFF
jgi:hypothetical protein